MTERPNDISQEAWYLALPFVVEHFGGSGPTTVGFRRTHLIIARAVMTAMAEEREACAVKAETYPFRSFEQQEPNKSVFGWGRCRKEIAAAIRKREGAHNG